MTRSISVRVHPDGKIEVESMGTKGPQCIQNISFAKRVLDVDEEIEKPEMYEEDLELDLDQELGDIV